MKRSGLRRTRKTRLSRTPSYAFGGGGMGGSGDISVEFGNLTLAGYGGVGVTGTSIDSGDPSGHWQIVGGKISPSVAGNSASLNLAPYTLTLDNGQSVNISTVSNSYSVIDPNELELTAELAGLALGEEILCRSGDYNPDRTDTDRIRRSTNPTGTWNGSNYVVIKPHSGANPVFYRLQFDSGAGGTRYFRVTGCAFSGSDDGVYGGSASPMLNIIGGADNILIDNCTFDAGPSNKADASKLPVGIRVNSASASDIRVEDNTITNVYDGVVLQGDDGTVIGNTITNAWSDCIKLTPPCARADVSWNTMYDKTELTGASPDFIQGNFSGATAGELDDINVQGNLMWRGTGTTGSDDGQGIFFADNAVDINNLVVEGNMYYGVLARGISITSSVGGLFQNNVILKDYDITVSAAKSGLYLSGGSGNIVRNNVYNEISDTSTGATITNNHTAGTVTLVAYQALFDDPDTGAGVTDLEAQFSIKSGSVLALADPKIGAAGTGYVDYTNRTTSFPAGTDTDPAFANVGFLAGFNGTDGDTSYTEESSAGASVISWNGTANLSGTAPKFGATSLDVTGNHQQYIRFPAASAPDWSGDVTIRFWFKRNGGGGSSAETIVSHYDTGSNQRSWVFAINEGSNDFRFLFSTDGGGTLTNLTGTLTGDPQNDGQWHEVAITLEDATDTYKVYFDGVEVGSLVNAGRPFASSAPFIFGNFLSNGSESTTWDFNGYIDEVRWSSELEITGDYTPRTSEFPRS